ncbi:hypothetical protein BAE44_0010215 [Dichanthelium oligosanthes]|uniref:Uncharacterized protein n=1 Tax=Dichanthelium oligosanthes TaxID=888268 RepID=A0A1E5VUG8_9POAL|nr:hypothetical protein BAE44_0010215 [Dichanthelium oligosanthes]
METRRHQQRSRSARGPPPAPPHHHHQGFHPRHHRQQNPILSPAAAASSFVARPRHHRPLMEDDALSTLMDIDDSPLGASGAGFLDEEDGEGEMFLAPHRGGRGGEVRGPLPFSGFYNSFDGADFDDADLA